MAAADIELKVHLDLVEFPKSSGFRRFFGHFFINLGYAILGAKSQGVSNREGT